MKKKSNLRLLKEIKDNLSHVSLYTHVSNGDEYHLVVKLKNGLGYERIFDDYHAAVKAYLKLVYDIAMDNLMNLIGDDTLPF